MVSTPLYSMQHIMPHYILFRRVLQHRDTALWRQGSWNLVVLEDDLRAGRVSIVLNVPLLNSTEHKNKGRPMLDQSKGPSTV